MQSDYIHFVKAKRTKQKAARADLAGGLLKSDTFSFVSVLS